MPKTIKVELSPDSIDKAIKELRQYQKDLTGKAEQIRKRIAEELKTLSEIGFNGEIYDDVFDEGGMRVPDVQVSVESDGDMSVVIAYGEEAVFVEFGAGVYYNGPVGSFQHPKAEEVGVKAIGTYGYGSGAQEIWEYTGADGQKHKTHGTPASMPMYYAIQSILPKIPDIAKEVFSGGDNA